MKLGTLALKVLGFFAFVFSFFMWGSTKAKLRQAIKEKNEAIKASRTSNEIKSKPYVAHPFRRMLRKK